MDWPRLITTRLPEQSFGLNISPQDILVPFFNNQGTNYFRPWKLCEEMAKECGSTIDNTKDKFKITLDVQHFLPKEISVKVNDNEIIIEGKHEERKDEHGFISRQFTRRYAMPKDCLTESVASTLSSDGVLTVMANKKMDKEIKTDEKVVPIKMTGPCRNTETTEDQNKMMKEQSKTESVKNGTCEMKKETEMQKDKKESQTTMKEEHCRLLKPELLKEAASGTEKILSESRKETDELLKLISADRTVTNTGGKLEEAIGQCKTLIDELKKDKTAETNVAASAEMSSMKSSMMSETIQSFSSTSSSTSSSMKATSETTKDVSEIITELKEAAENI